MTHDFLNDLQVGFVLAEASAECVPQDMAAKLWQKNRVTIFFLRLGFFFLIIVCTNRADSAVDGIGEINLSIASAENKAGVPINFIGAETNDLLILVFFQKGIEHFINHWNNADSPLHKYGFLDVDRVNGKLKKTEGVNFLTGTSGVILALSSHYYDSSMVLRHLLLN